VTFWSEINSNIYLPQQSHRRRLLRLLSIFFSIFLYIFSPCGAAASFLFLYDLWNRRSSKTRPTTKFRGCDNEVNAGRPVADLRRCQDPVSRGILGLKPFKGSSPALERAKMSGLCPYSVNPSKHQGLSQISGCRDARS